MKSQHKKILQTTLSFAFAGTFLYLAFRGVKFDDLLKSLLEVNYFWVILLMPITLISHWLRAVRWAYLLSPVKEKLSTRNLFSAVMIGYLVNNIFVRAGEVVRAYAIGKSEGISRSAAFATIIVERILDMMTFFFSLCVVLFLYPQTLNFLIESSDTLQSLFPDVESMRPFFLIGAFGALALFLILFIKSESLFQLLTHLKMIVPRRYETLYQSLVEKFLSGFSVARLRKHFAAISFLSLLIWIFYALGLFVPFYAFESLTGLQSDFGASVILLTITTIAWVLPSPGAFGTYHSFLTVALVKMYQVNDVTAISYSIITHEAGILVTTAVGLYYFFKDHLKISEVNFESNDDKKA
ncbi:MAG: lysylphosphatidylglycerol synthase transmembrane domain-containing protein [bacterium]